MAAQSISLSPPAPLVLDPSSIHQNNQWIQFKEKIDLYFVASNITDARQQKALLLYIGGDELKLIYETLDPTSEKNYTQAIAALDGHFVEKVNYTFERYNFRNTEQLPNESARNFITRLRTSVSKCDFDKYSNEEAIIDTFIEKTSDPKLRRKLLRESKLTVTKVLQIAADVESAELHANVLEKQNNTEEFVNKVRSQSNMKKDFKSYNKSNNNEFRQPKKSYNSTLKCYGCDRTGHLHGSEECPALNQLCNYCGMKNHFEVACQRKKRQPNFNRSNPSRPQNKFPASRKDFSNVIQDEEDSDDEYLFSLNSVSDITVKLDNYPISFLRDSGASINIIDSDTYEKLARNKSIELHPTKTKIFSYNSTQPIELNGVFYSNASYGNNHHLARVFVAANKDAGCILGRETAVELGVISLKEVIHKVTSEDSDINNIITEFKDTFQGLGKMKDIEITFDIDETVKPVSQHLRRIPYHMRKKVEKKIRELIDLDIIEPVVGTTPWISPVVAIPKGEEIRLVVDMRQPNQAIRRSHHPIPTLQELLVHFNGCKFFSKLDLLKGYHQLVLEEKSRYITAFVTHEGVFQYKRLVQGVNDAFTVYQYTIGQLFKQENLIQNICDDILIGGRDKDEHDRKLRKCLEILRDNNLTVNPEKCIFGAKEVSFYGHIISEDGIKPTDSIVEAILSFTEPINKKEVRSFLGLVNYLGIFINNLSTINAPLRKLIKENTRWNWGTKEKAAFHKLKTIVTSDLCITHFNPARETILITDAGKEGLGAILAQKQDNDCIKPISYASRSLTKQEMKYSQTEREALGVVWACEHYHLYLYGKPFTILSDHEPLKILYSPKGKPSPRILRWGLRLQSYEFKIEYIKGKMNPADILSIKPLQTCKDIEIEMEKYINSIIAYSTPKAVSISDIVQHSINDKIIQKVINCLSNDVWENSKDINDYYKIRSELSFKSGVLMKNEQLVIPESLQDKILSASHEYHLGIVRTKALLRQKVWWPKMNKQIENMVLNCTACISVSNPKKEPMGHNSVPIEKPWQKVHVDYCGPFPDGTYLLGIIDSSSRWPELFITKDISSRNTLKLLKKCFSTHGYPTTIVTDNAPNLVSANITEFCDLYKIKHKRATPYWPQSNAEIERFYRTVSKYVKTLTNESRNWKEELGDFLLTYRNTPHSTTGTSPAMLLMNRTLRDKIPNIDCHENKIFEEVQNIDKNKKEKYKEYYDKRNKVKASEYVVGDTVIMKSKKKGKLLSKFEIIPCKITKVCGSQITVTRNGKEITRNSSEFKRIKENPTTETPMDEYEDTEVSNSPNIPVAEANPTNAENLANPDLANPTNEEENPNNRAQPSSTPVRNQIIEFKRTDSENWEKGIVMHNQPKKSGKYAQWINIYDEETDKAQRVNFEYVEQWRVIQE